MAIKPTVNSVRPKAKAALGASPRISTSIPKAGMPLTKPIVTKIEKYKPMKAGRKPKKEESTALKRYRVARNRVKYYRFKLEVIGHLTKGEEFQYKRAQARVLKFKKMAAPELIRINLKKKASRGKGKRRGSDLAKFMSKPTPSKV